MNDCHSLVSGAVFQTQNIFQLRRIPTDGGSEGGGKEKREWDTAMKPPTDLTYIEEYSK